MVMGLKFCMRIVAHSESGAGGGGKSIHMPAYARLSKSSAAAPFGNFQKVTEPHLSRLLPTWVKPS
jgi:hypothetical protein